METDKKTAGENQSSKIIATSAGVLTAAVLAYCGYKIVKNQLEKTTYDPDPNKKIS